MNALGSKPMSNWDEVGDEVRDASPKYNTNRKSDSLAVRDNPLSSPSPIVDKRSGRNEDDGRSGGMKVNSNFDRGVSSNWRTKTKGRARARPRAPDAPEIGFRSS